MWIRTGERRVLKIMDLEALWANARASVLPAATSPAQQNWLNDTQAVGYAHPTVILAAPHQFARDWIESQLGASIEAALSSEADAALTALITVQPNPETSGTPTVDTADTGGEHTPLEAPGRPPGPFVEVMGRAPSHEPRRSSPQQRGRTTPAVSITSGRSDDNSSLNPRHTFDDFVIGASNRFAHAAATTVAEAPAKSYNPLFIYGRAGLGKTHLLHAIGNYIDSVYTRLQVRYVTSEQFTNDFIRSIRNKEQSHFHELYRNTDVLLVDDIQFLEGKEGTQEEFFHTFNALHQSERQIVIASDRPPKKMTQLDDRLRSRFEWGLAVDIQPPDLETRIAILQSKAERENFRVPSDVLSIIASRVDSNIRELEGALIRVSAHSSVHGLDLTPSLAEQVLKDLFPDSGEQEISVGMIQEEVAEFFGFSIEELCSPSRSRQLTTARQIAMYLVRELTALSLPAIGKAFGGRDHTTVIHANKKIAGLMQEKQTVYNQVQELTGRVKNRARGGRR
jgi:chromosomal replication initiator protein